jgi:hypothetical protein
MTFVVLLAAGTSPQDSREISVIIRELLGKHFKVLNGQERAVLESRILRSLEALPRNPMLQDQALRHIADTALGAMVFLNAVDEYRPLAARDPRFSPLVLPDEYHRLAYEAAVQRVEADLARSQRFEGRSPERMAQVDLQLETLKAGAKRILERQLPGIQTPPKWLNER